MVTDMDDCRTDLLSQNRSPDDTVIPERVEQFREEGQYTKFHGVKYFSPGPNPDNRKQ
jgi:hypothetical protein